MPMPDPADPTSDLGRQGQSTDARDLDTRPHSRQQCSKAGPRGRIDGRPGSACPPGAARHPSGQLSIDIERMLATLTCSAARKCCRNHLGLRPGQQDESPADQFASWLPYVRRLPEEQQSPRQSRHQILLEIMPQVRPTTVCARVLISLYANCRPPPGIHSSTCSSPHPPQLRRYANLRMEDADRLSGHSAGASPLDNLFPVLARLALRLTDQQAPRTPRRKASTTHAGLPG